MEIVNAFTSTDAQLIEKLFEEKLSGGYAHINVSVKVKDLSIPRHMSRKGFWQGNIFITLDKIFIEKR